MIFLPAYAPFYNIIEIVFGIAKGKMQHFYKENGSQDLKMFVAEVMNSFVNFNMSHLFRKCGYISGGKFDKTSNVPEELVDLSLQ